MPGLGTHQEVMEAVLAGLGDDERRVVVAHAFVAGGQSSDSERLLSIGGAGTIDAAVFDDFEYVALGHLHRPQSVTPRVHYAGSLLRYSASEIEHDKSVTVVDVGERTLDVRRHPITPRRQLRRVEDTLAGLLDSPQEPLEDYVIARLLDKGPVFEAMSRIRAIYPNALHIERPEMSIEGQVGVPDRQARSLDPRELFLRFYEDVHGEPLDAQHLSALEEVLQHAQEAAK